MQLSDYAQALGAAQALIPQWDQPERDRAALQGQQVQNQLGQQQVVASQQAVADHQRATERHAAFETALQQAGSNPDPSHLRAIGVQFPEFAEPLLKMVDGMDRSRRDQVFHDTSQVYAGLGNAAGYAGARSIIQRHVDADRAAGRDPDPTDMDMLTAIDSGDPAKIATARGLARAIATAASPEGAKTLFSDENANHFTSTADGAVYDQRTGGVVRQAPARPEYRTVKNADGSESIVAVNAEGGGQASGGESAPYSRANIRGSESNGNDSATNPHGTAAGRYQITAPTALRLIVQNPAAFPEMQGQGAAARAAFARRPEVQERMMDILEPQYRTALGTVGAAATGGNMYMMHFLGTSTGPKFIAADPTADARETIRRLDPRNADRIISGNGAIFAAGKTVGDVRTEIGRRYAQASGGGSGGDGFSRSTAAAPSGAQVVYTSRPNATTDSSLSGPAFIASLSPGRANLLRAISEGRAPAPRPGSRFGEQLAEDLARAYPDADTTRFATRQQTLTAFSKGTQGNTVRSINVAVDHLGVLHDAALALRNGDVPLFNRLSQRWQTATGGPLPSNARAIASIVGDEVVKAVVGSAGALADRQDLRDQLNVAGSPEQIAGVTRGYLSLMAGQARGLQLQYEQGTGNHDFHRFLNHTTARLLGDHPAQTSQQSAPQGSRQVGTYQGRAVYQLPDGRRVVAKQ